MIKHLSITLMALLGAGLLSLSAWGQDTIEEKIASMSVEEKVGQMFMPAFRWWKDNPEADAQTVLSLNDSITATIARGHFGGIILFTENIQSTQQTMELICQMQAANQMHEGAIPLLIAADQEGGAVARLAMGTRMPGNMALSATGDTSLVKESARLMGEELSLLGINTDFAPVVDVNNNPSNPVIGVRSFGDTPSLVSRNAVAFVEGLKESGTITVLKHFPGHGDTGTDSHTGFPLVDKSYEELSQTELVPFKDAIAAGADMIMTAHIQYPQIEHGTHTSITTGEEVSLPATLSKTILTDILRGELGFDGVIVSDALEMAAISDNFSKEDVCRLAIDAGIDLFLMPITPNDEESLAALENMISFIVTEVKEGRIDEAKVDDAVRHILTLKQSHGILDHVATEVTEEALQAAQAKVGCEENRAKEWSSVQKAITVVKGEELLPLSVESGEKVVVYCPSQSRMLTPEFARLRMAAEGLIPEDVTFESHLFTASPEEQEAVLEECLSALPDADHVLILTAMWSLGELDPRTADGVDSDTVDQIIATAHEMGKQVVLVSINLPYDVARYQEADALLLCYGSYPMNSLPQNGEAYMATLPAALCGIFGEFPMTGSLPVSIPTLDGEYHFTEEILYPREVE